MRIFYALFVFCLFGSAYSEGIRCAAIGAVPDVDLNNFLGVWHGVEYYPPRTLPPVCLVHNYTQIEIGFYRLRALCIRGFDTSTEEFTRPCYNLNSYINSVDVFDKRTSGDHVLRRPSATGPMPGGVKIVGTDQASFYVEYTCTGNSATEINAEIYTRDANPSSSVMESAYKVLEANGLNRNAMVKFDNSDCERYDLYRILHSS